MAEDVIWAQRHLHHLSHTGGTDSTPHINHPLHAHTDTEQLNSLTAKSVHTKNQQVLFQNSLSSTDKEFLSDIEEEINLSPVYEHLHQNGPPKPRTYHCSQCLKSTNSPRLHLHHLINEHGLDLTIYECDLCDYATKYKQKLIHHCNTHGASSLAGVPNTARSHCDMLGTSTKDDSHQEKNLHYRTQVDSTEKLLLDASAAFLRMRDINENVKHSRNTTDRDLATKEKMESGKLTMGSRDEQDLLCNESVANDSAEFDYKSAKSTMRDDEDGNNLIIDLGENQNMNQNNNNVDATPAILRAVSLATANSMVARPTMVPVTLSVKRDMDVRPMPTPPATSTGPKLTKKGTVPVREAVDPAKYVRLQDVDGVRYACSKCGNVYKWRKSLNKHWKEKHDGEIPVPASGSFSNILNIPHIKGGPPQYSTPKSSATSTRTLATPSMLNSSGGISSYALDKYIVDMGAQSGGRPIQSYNSTSNSSAAAANAAAAAAVMATRNMLNKPGGFNSMLHTNIPFPNAQAQQHLAFGGMRFMKPDITATTNVLPKFPNFSPLPQDRMRLPTILPPAAHGRALMKHEVLDDDSCDDMPLDLSKKSTSKLSDPDLTSSSASIASSRPGSAVAGDQPLDFSVKSNPGSERSTPVQAMLTRDRDDSVEQPWMRATSTPESDIYNNLQCYKCPFVASDKASFEDHLEQHTNQSQYPQCAQCKQHFSSNDELTQHFGLHHLHVLNQLNSTDEANQQEKMSSTQAGQLYQYLTKPHESKDLKCVVCNARFPWQRDLTRHFNHLHPDLPNPYNKKRMLEMDGHENEPWHKMSKFEQYGSNEGKQGTSEGELECEQCTFVARDLAEMSRHQLVHSFNRQHACTMCGFSSKTREELQSHMWKYHPNQAEELALMASNGGATPISVAKARGTPVSASEDSPGHGAADTSGSSAHSGEFGYDDVIIVTPNTTEVPLVRGRKSGKGGTSSSAEILLPYKCSVCEYRARWPSEITQHMKNHSDEKPYHCPRCTYKSKWKWDVVKHLKRCGGGTVKDVIDTSRSMRKSDQEDPSLGSHSVVKQLQFRNSSPKPHSLSNGPPNVTLFQSTSPHTLGSHESQRSCSPTSSSSDVISYSRNTCSPANSVNSEPAINHEDPNEPYSDKSKIPMFQGLINQGRFHCLQCPFIANSPAELKRHCRVHSDEKPYSCQTCGYSTKWKCDLKKHLRTYNHSRAPRSERHGEKFGDENRDDNISSSDEMSIDLASEEQRSFSPNELPAPKPTLYKCDKCQYVTYKKNFLDGHMKIHRQAHEKSGKLKCKQCDFEASDLPSFLQHKLTHSSQQAVDTSPMVDLGSTNFDSQKGERETSPQRHRRKPLKYLTCSKCPYSCLHQAKLDVHESMHEPRGPGSFTCEFCDYNVYNRALLLQHMKLHPEFEVWYHKHGHAFENDQHNEIHSAEMDEAEQAESFCGLLTEDPKKHMPKNSKGGMKLMLTNPSESGLGFQCSKCVFQTTKRNTFEEHIRQHGCDQEFQCEHCDWSTERLSKLYNHVREVHPHQLTLNEHKDNNIEERTLARKQQTCSDCGYTTENRSKMSSHRIKHKSEKNKKCHYCSQIFGNTAEMGKHLLAVHDVEVTNEYRRKFSEIKLENNRNHFSRKLTCCHCPYGSESMETLQRHMEMHEYSGRFTCDHCDFSVDNENQLHRHLSVHQKANGRMKNRKSSFSLKIQGKNAKVVCKPVVHRAAMPIPAGRAGTSNRYRSAKKHLSIVCKSNMIKQHRAVYPESKDKNMIQKTNGEHNKRKRNPPKLRVILKAVIKKDMRTLRKGLFDAHRRFYNCQDCPFTCNKPQVYTNHVRCRFRCDKCPYHTHTKPLLDLHLRMHRLQQDGSKSYFKCESCQYQTDNKNNLDNHKCQYHVTGKLLCPYCDYSSDHTAQLGSHIKLHFPNSPLDAAVLRELISRAKDTCNISPDMRLTLQDGNPSLISPKFTLNNNNMDPKRGAMCQYCERDFTNEAERNQHERQHLIGSF